MEELKWFAGLSVSVLGVLITAIIAAFRALSGRILAGDQKLADRIDQVKDDYVRRDDFKEEITRVRDDIKEVRTEMRESTSRVRDAISKANSDGG